MDPSRLRTAIGPQKLVERLGGAESPLFSFCTMVTDWPEYEAMRASARARGFTDESCEWIVLDNSQGNKADAFVATNEFLQAASGPFVVLCHQDIQFLVDGRSELEDCLMALDRLDPAWAVAGNAGVAADGLAYLAISDPGLEAGVFGKLPKQVRVLDENFMVVRKSANLGVSRDLSGFHHYGTDLCLVARNLGWTCWVVDFFLRHNSAGLIDARYHRSLHAIEAKYAALHKPQWIWLITGYNFHSARGSVHFHLTRLARRVAKALGKPPQDRPWFSPTRMTAEARHRAAAQGYRDARNMPGGQQET